MTSESHESSAVSTAIFCLAVGFLVCCHEHGRSVWQKWHMCGRRVYYVTNHPRPALYRYCTERTVSTAPRAACRYCTERTVTTAPRAACRYCTERTVTTAPRAAYRYCTERTVTTAPRAARIEAKHIYVA